MCISKFYSFIHPLLGIALVLHGLVLCGVPIGLLGLSRPPCLGIALTLYAERRALLLKKIEDVFVLYCWSTTGMVRSPYGGSTGST